MIEKKTFSKGLLIIVLFSMIIPINLIGIDIDNYSSEKTQVPYASPTPDPLVHYTFDMNYSDSQMRGQDIGISGNVYRYDVGGISGGYAYVDGQSDYAFIPFHLMYNLPSNFTIQLWYKQTKSEGFTQEILGKGNNNDYNYRITSEPAQGANPIFAGYNKTSGGWINLENYNSPIFNEWHLVTFIKTQDHAKYYIDDKLINSIPTIDQAKTNTYPVFIGKGAKELYIDELKIWNVSLSQEDILNYYANYKPIANFSMNNDNVDMDEVVSFTDLSYGGNGPYSYYWDFGDGSYSYDWNPTHAYTKSGIFDVHLTITDMNFYQSTIKKMINVRFSLPVPIVNYTFDSGLTDSMGNGTSIQLLGDVSTIDSIGGVSGGYLNVSTLAGYAEIPHFPALSLDFTYTIQFWFKQYEYQTFIQDLISKGPSGQYNYRIYRNSFSNNMAPVVGEYQSMFYNTVSLNYDNDLQHNQWHLVTLVKGNGYGGLYLDGQMIIEIVDSDLATTNEWNIKIGYLAENTMFDEIVIWSEALGQEQIMGYYSLYRPTAMFSVNNDFPENNYVNVEVGEMVSCISHSFGGFPFVPPAAPYEIHWDYGDGYMTSIQNPNHMYMTAGDYTITLTVTDSTGNSSIAKKTVHVSQATSNIPSDFTLSGYYEDGRVYLSWSASNNADTYKIFFDSNQYDQRNSNERSSNYEITEPGVHTFYVKAENSYGSKDSNSIQIQVPVFPDNFILRSNAGNPDGDGNFTLTWDHLPNADNYKVYQSFENSTPILINTFPKGINSTFVSLPQNGHYIIYVIAKNMESGNEKNSNSVAVVVDLDGTNDDKKSDSGSADGDMFEDILNFLQENGGPLGLGIAGIAALGVVFKMIKGRKGKFKLKGINTGNTGGGSGAFTDDFFDSEF